jgi:catechol 2,3-dioxygenase-like lactoylglutathione lyase family enzyme
MDAQTLHRGRLIDHIQLVVHDLPASRHFYGALFDVLGVPISGEEESYFWVDELRHRQRRRARTADRTAPSGVSGCGPHHGGGLSQARASGGSDNRGPGERPITPVITPPS